VSALSVARQYANALYQVAEAHQRTEPVGRDLADLARLVEQHADLKAVFETPLVVPRKKRALVDALAAASPDITVEVRRLLEMLADRNRLMLVAEIAAAFARRVMAADRVVAADVVTAVPLDEGRKASLAQALGQATGQTVTITDRVDPGIIGGVVARVGSLVFDGSVVRQIERMRQTLLGDA
jgi:F-type H+-transporting ATPase subunit delta